MKSGPGVEELLAVEPAPVVIRGERRVALPRERVGRRPQREQVEDEGLAVPAPAVAEKPALRPPAVGQGAAAVGGPGPFDPAVEAVGDVPDLALLLVRAAKIRRGRERAGEQVRGVHRRELAVPRAAARAHVEEVIVEALVARRVRVLSVGAVPEETQGRQRARRGLRALHEAALRGDDVTAERQPHGGDRSGGADVRAVAHEAGRGVGLVQEVAEGVLLQPVQVLFGVCGRRHEIFATALWTASASVGWMWTASRSTV